MNIECTKNYKLNLDAQELHDIKLALKNILEEGSINSVIKTRIAKIYDEMESVSQ